MTESGMINPVFAVKRLILGVLLIAVLVVGCTNDSPDNKPSPNQLPSAFIDSIYPDEVSSGEKISFMGHGIDSDGTVVTYRWRSSLDGDISTIANFTASSLSEGKHTIFFKVQDNGGVWSAEVQKAVIVIPAKPAPVPVIEYFRVAPERISSGSYAALSWYVTDATTVYLDREIGNVPLTGNLKVYPIISTQYTLTAINEGSSVTARVIVLVVAGKVGLPVINSFAADPGNITAGSSAALNWNISNVEYVKIEPSIGDVEPVGSISVSPAKTTDYTLTAYNAVGFVLSTTQLMVTTAAVSGRPDLVIADISRVETASGVRIAYTVENRGTNDAPPSTTKLYANGAYQALDSLGVVTAGGLVTRQITGWLYNPATSIIKIAVDADSNIVESDEGNNVQQVSFPPKAIFDFIDSAGGAKWGLEYPYKGVAFGELLVTGKEGVALYKPGKRMEDTSVPGRMLETRPYAIYNGWIMGDYDTGLQIKPGYYFYGLVGLVEGATSGNVQFWVYIRSQGEADWEPLVSDVDDIYDYRIKSISVPVPPKYFGKNVDFSLRVSANGEPMQDWAAWVEAKIIR